jgi:precorrin-6B methylase 1
VLVGARCLLDLFSDAGAERIAVDADIERVLDGIEKRRGFKRIVVLVTGDPGLFSLAQPVIRRFGRRGGIDPLYPGFNGTPRPGVYQLCVYEPDAG